MNEAPGEVRVATGGQRSVETAEDVVLVLLGRPGDRALVTRHLTEVRRERAHRRDDLQRVAMRLDHDGVGVLGEQLGEVPEVRGGLQDPAVGHVP